MNENINLCELLRGYEGKEFYCSLLGENVYLKTIRKNELVFDCPNSARGNIVVFSNGAYYIAINGECIIFPSKDQREWNKWAEVLKSKVPKTWSQLKECNVEILAIVKEIEKYKPLGESVNKSALALLKIHQLIEVSYGGNITSEEWKNNSNPKCCIYLFNSRIEKANFACQKELIAFHTEQQRDEFLSYPENVQLIKDFYMI